MAGASILHSAFDQPPQGAAPARHMRSEDPNYLQSDEILAAIVRDSDDAILSKTLDAVITSWNPGAERMYGYTADEVIGQPVSILVPKNLADDIDSIMARIKMGERVHHYETLRRHKDGQLIHVSLTVSPIRNKHGEIVGASAIARDITARRQAERTWTESMSYLAYHDAVTGLPNRLLLNDRLKQALSEAHRHQKKLAVVFFDLDNFKWVNDRLGHDVGDAFLKSVANNLVACLRSNDTVSRYGGDEFVIILPGIKDSNGAATAVRKMTASLETVHRIGPHELQVTASIGISIYPDHGETGEVLVSKADAAMYRAKSDKGGTKFQFAG